MALVVETYLAAQVQATSTLIGQRGVHFANVIGHGELRLRPGGGLNKRIVGRESCPGYKYPWRKLAADPTLP